MDNSLELARSLNELGALAKDDGQFEEARTKYKESLIMAREVVNEGTRIVAINLYCLGLLAYAEMKFDEARKHLTECEPMIHLLVTTEMGVNFHHALGAIAFQDKDLEAARKHFQAGLGLIDGYQPQEEGDMRHALGDVAFQSQDYERARSDYKAALRCYKELPDRTGIAYSLESFACFAAHERRWKRAARLFGAAEGLRDFIKRPLAPVEIEEYAPYINATREALGQMYELFHKQGREMPHNDMIVFALSDEDEP